MVEFQIKEYDMGFLKYEDMTKAQKYVYDIETKYPGIATIYYDPKDFEKINTYIPQKEFDRISKKLIKRMKH